MFNELKVTNQLRLLRGLHTLITSEAFLVFYNQQTEKRKEKLDELIDAFDLEGVKAMMDPGPTYRELRRRAMQLHMTGYGALNKHDLREAVEYHEREFDKLRDSALQRVEEMLRNGWFRDEAGRLQPPANKRSNGCATETGSGIPPPDAGGAGEAVLGGIQSASAGVVDEFMEWWYSDSAGAGNIEGPD